ncbi:hypothetical protein PG995_004616 [Apiospora arundinis]
MPRGSAPGRKRAFFYSDEDSAGFVPLPVALSREAEIGPPAGESGGFRKSHSATLCCLGHLCPGPGHYRFLWDSNFPFNGYTAIFLLRVRGDVGRALQAYGGYHVLVGRGVYRCVEVLEAVVNNDFGHLSFFLKVRLCEIIDE